MPAENRFLPFLIPHRSRWTRSFWTASVDVIAGQIWGGMRAENRFPPFLIPL